MMVNILKMAAVLIGAALLGNWFLDEVRKARRGGKPWYQPYVSPPGLLILALIILLPVAVRLLK
jgi:hypothetical protein